MQVKKIKNINLKILPSGKIVLTVPVRVSNKKMLDFLHKNKDWIDKNYGKVVSKNKKIEYENGESIDFLGKKYTLEIREIDKGREKAEILSNNILIMNVLKENAVNKEKKEKILENFYRMQAKKYLSPLTERWAEKCNLEYSEIRIRKAKRIWGSCNTKKKIITYNIFLITKDIECIEYVVVHELCHLVHPNHGKEFKKLLEKYIPEYKKIEKRLNGKN